MNFDITKTEEAINKTFPSIVMFIRDANLEEAIVNKYEPQMILREKGFTDASCKVGGMITTHRYIILSNHISNFTEYENGTD